MKIKDVISANLNAWMASSQTLQTAKQLGSKSKVGASTILRIKNATTNPTIDNLQSIADAFKRDLTDLITPPKNFHVSDNVVEYYVDKNIDPLQADLDILDKYEADTYITRVDTLKSEIATIERRIKIIEADVRAAADKIRKQQEKSDLKPDPAAQDSPLSDRRTA